MAKKPETGKPDGFSQFKQHLKTGEFERLYLFSGEEHFLRDHYLQQLKRKLLDGPAEDFNYHRFTPENMDLQALGHAVEAMPMMAEFTLVQIDDFDFSKFSDSQKETLAQILSDIPDYCVVVFVFDTVEYKSDKKLQAVFSAAVSVEFARQSQRELNSWIRRHFHALDKEIGDRQCEYLTFVTGGTMTALNAEISKIAAYAQGNSITEQDINAVIIPVLDAEVFQITDSISAGDYETALLKLRTLLQMQEDPIYLLGAIGSAMRRLYYAKICLSAGKGEGQLGDMLKSSTGRMPHPYVLQKTLTAARRVSDHFCKAAMELCLDADRKLKSYTGNEQRTLELLLLQLAQEARRD